jgi:hypothetical protein
MDDTQLRAAIRAMCGELSEVDDGMSELRRNSLRVRAVVEGVFAATGRREFDVTGQLAQQLLEELDRRELVVTETSVWGGAPEARGLVSIVPAAIEWAAIGWDAGEREALHNAPTADVVRAAPRQPAPAVEIAP